MRRVSREGNQRPVAATMGGKQTLAQSATSLQLAPNPVPQLFAGCVHPECAEGLDAVQVDGRSCVMFSGLPLEQE